MAVKRTAQTANASLGVIFCLSAEIAMRHCLAAVLMHQLRALCWTGFGFDYRVSMAVIGTRLR
jgi:hypothetical protein